MLDLNELKPEITLEAAVAQLELGGINLLPHHVLIVLNKIYNQEGVEGMLSLLDALVESVDQIMIPEASYYLTSKQLEADGYFADTDSLNHSYSTDVNSSSVARSKRIQILNLLFKLLHAGKLQIECSPINLDDLLCLVACKFGKAAHCRLSQIDSLVRTTPGNKANDMSRCFRARNIIDNPCGAYPGELPFSIIEILEEAICSGYICYQMCRYTVPSQLIEVVGTSYVEYPQISINALALLTNGAIDTQKILAIAWMLEPQTPED